MLATAFTLVALPSLWLFDRDDPAASPSVAAAGVPAPAVVAVVDDAATERSTTTEPELPVFLEAARRPTVPVIATAATPAPTSHNEIVGHGTFKRFDAPYAGRCTVLEAPSNATITVTNISNGLSVTCVNMLGGSTLYGVVVTLDTDLFVTIANLVDAPVHVRVDW